MNQVSVKHLKFLIFNLSTLYKKNVARAFQGRTIYLSDDWHITPIVSAVMVHESVFPTHSHFWPAKTLPTASVKIYKIL